MRFTSDDIGDGVLLLSRVTAHEAWLLYTVEYGGPDPGAVLVLHEAMAHLSDRPEEVRAGIARALNALAEDRWDTEIVRALTSEPDRWRLRGLPPSPATTSLSGRGHADSRKRVPEESNAAFREGRERRALHPPDAGGGAAF